MIHRNIVLVCLDSVRKDYFDAHATRLRERAALDFDQCRAASSWSVPSHASMFTGTLPHEHGIHTHNRDFSGLSPENTFLGDLPEYRTLGASANVWAGSSFGFDALFDEFSDISPDRRFSDGIDVGQFGQSCDAEGFHRQLAFLRAALEADHPLASIANGVFVQLDDWFSRLPLPNLFDDGASIIAREIRSQIAASEEPFFLFANFMDAHGPLGHIRGYDQSLHDAPNSWTAAEVNWRDAIERGDTHHVDNYVGLYAAAVDYLDRRVCDLIDWIDAATDRETTIVVTSDHGDGLGTDDDDRTWGHIDSSLAEWLLHVPLVVVNPPETATEIDESAYVSHLSLGELLGGVSRGEVPDVTAGRVAAERIGHSGSLATVAEQRGTASDQLLRAVYDSERKYVWGSERGREAYRLDHDRPCHQEPSDEPFDPEVFKAFFDDDPTDYKRRAVDATAMSDVDDATLNRLEDLGYV